LISNFRKDTPPLCSVQERRQQR